MATLGDLVANLGVNAAPFTRGLATARSGLASFAGMAGGALGSVSAGIGGLMSFGGGISSFVTKLGMISIALMAIKGAAVGLTMPLTMAANAEKTQIAFTTMLKSADKAKTLIGQLNQFAAATPFEQPEIVDAGRKLLAFGIQAEHIIPTLTALGDVAAGIDAPIGELAELFGKMKTQGKLMSEDINQLTGRGIPIIQELAKQFRKPESAIKKMVESGQVNFSHLQKAFASMSGKGGQFAGLMDAQSRTTSGLWSTLKDNLGQTFQAIGGALIEGFNLKGLMTSSIGFLETFRSTWLPGIAATISAVGTKFQEITAWLTALWSNWITNSQAWLLSWRDTFSAGMSQAFQFAGDLLGWFQGVFSTVAGVFTAVWNRVFGGAGDTFAFMIRNWYTLLQIGLQNVILFASNSWKSLGAFFENFARWIEWLPGNWSKVMFTLGDLLSTVFINMAKNVGNFFKALWDFAKGKGFKFEATGLTEGFHNSIDKLPEMVSAAVDQSTPELARLYDKLNADEAAFQKKQADRANDANRFGGLMTKLSGPDLPKQKTLADIATKNGDQVETKKKDKHELKAVEARSAEAFRAIVAGTNQGPPKVEEKIATNGVTANKLLTELVTETKKTTTAVKGVKQPKPARLT